MKKKFYCAIATMLAVTSVASASPLRIPGVETEKQSDGKPMRVKDITETGWVKVVEEDFSAMTNGSYDVPDDTPLTDEDIIIPEEYTSMPDWSGARVYQAGGACAINFPATGGYLNTPEVQMRGLVKVSFDAKVFDDIRAFDIFVCNNGIDDPIKVAPYQTKRMFNTDGWEHHELYFYNPGEEVAFVQFRVIYYGEKERGILLDNIVVEHQPAYIPEVDRLSASAFTPEGFLLKWSPSELTDEYLVSIYEETPVSTSDRVFREDFENFQTDADGIITSGADGWNLTLRDTHPWIMEHTSGKALVLGRHEEIVEFPSFGGRFKEFRMDITHILGDNPKAWGTMADVEGWNGSEWVWITGFSSEDNYFTFDLGAWEDEPDFFEPEEKHFRGLYTKLRLVVGSANYGSLMLIDNVEFECEPDTETVAVVDGEKTNGTSYKFEGMNPDARYYAGVRAVTDEYKSDEKLCEAFGIAAPVALKAEDVTDESFVARWEPAYNAVSHQVSSYDCLVVGEDVEAFSVLDDDFSLVSEASDSYYHPDRIQITELDNYTARSGWTGNGVAKVQGHLGCSACALTPGSNFLITLDLTLDNNDGEFDVVVKAWVRKDSKLVVMSLGDGLSSDFMEEDGLFEFTFHMKNGRKHDQLAFLSYDGQAFFIDEVKVIQSLKKNDILLEGMATYVLGSDDSEQMFEMKDRDSAWTRAYDVRASRQSYSQTAVSDYSSVVIVDESVDVDSVAADNAALITVEGLNLRITLLEDNTVAVYSVNGSVVANVSGVAGVNDVTLPSAGVYVVRIGNRSHKIIAL